MGWETLAVAGFSALQAVNTIQQGNAQARAIDQQAQQQAQNEADNTLRSAGRVQTSFLQSGITLEGGPMQAITQAFTKGQTDIGRIASNANNAASNAINAARSKALQGLASSAAGAAGGASILSGAGDAASGFADGFSQGFDNPTAFQTGALPGDVGGLSYGPYQPQVLPWAQS